MTEYLAGQLRERQQAPRDDMLTDLAQAEITDDDGMVRRLDIEEGALFAMLLISVGTETVARLLGWSAVILDRHPDQRAELVADRALIPNVVEELLRYEAPSPVQGRWTTADAVFHDTTIPEGSKVLLLTGSAGRDERKYPDAERFDIHRYRQPARVVRLWRALLHRCRARPVSRGGWRSRRCSTATRAGRSTKPTAVDCTPAPCAVGSTSRSPSDDGRQPGGDCDRRSCAARDRRTDRHHHQRQPGEAQRVQRRRWTCELFDDPRRAEGHAGPAGRHLAGRGPLVVVGSRRLGHRRRPGGDEPPRAHDPRPPGHPAGVGPRGADHRRHAGVVDRRLVPAGAAVRHPGRRRRRPLHAPRDGLRRDPRHRRHGRSSTRCAATAS